MTVLCLAVVAGTSVSDIIRWRSAAVARVAVLVAALGVLSDGWIDRIPVAPAPSTAPNAALLTGARLLELPPDTGSRDIAATFRAVEGGWTTVNGYSGYRPNYSYALRDAAREETNDILIPFQRARELHVLVPVDAPRLTALVERQPGVVITGHNAAMIQYRLPRRPLVVPPLPGRRLHVARLSSECSSGQLSLAIDGDESTLWECTAEPNQRLLTADLGEASPVGRMVLSVGTDGWFVPVDVTVETSENGEHWREAGGNPLQEAFTAGLADPRRLRMALTFPRRMARYVRIRARAIDPGVPWLVTELEVWSGTERGEDTP